MLKGCNAMINAFHLIWIIPAAAAFGFAVAAVLAVAGEEGNHE